MMKNYLFIDGSYYVFYRFHSLFNWYKLSHPTENIDETLKVPFDNEEFRTKYISLFEKKLQEIPKKLKIENPLVFIGKDCKRSNIWRMNNDKEYKGTRVVEESKNPKEFFNLVYNEEKNLFINAFEKMKNPKRCKINIVPESKTVILNYNNLEADDCIALYVNNIIENEKDDYTITIITGDLDYLQLLKNDNIRIYNGGLKQLNNPKNSLGCYKKDLLMKIIIGDKSDNIESIMKKCGKKTALKYVEDKTLLDKLLEDDEIKAMFDKNRLMIDFDYIPLNLKEGFLQKYSYLLG
jgi:5'-3' exonuclease